MCAKVASFVYVLQKAQISEAETCAKSLRAAR